MKPYIVTTGALCAFRALAHRRRTSAEWSRLGTAAWFILEGPGIGVLAAAVAIWAWRVLRVPARVL